jgi:hypothetical protein
MIKDYSVDHPKEVSLNMLKEIFPDLRAVRRMPTRDEIDTQYDIMHHISSLNRDKYVRCGGMYVIPKGPFDTNEVKRDLLIQLDQKGSPIAASTNIYDELEDLVLYDYPFEKGFDSAEARAKDVNVNKPNAKAGMITKEEARARATTAGPLRSKIGKGDDKVDKAELKRVMDKNRKLNEEYRTTDAQYKEGKVIVDMEKRNRWREARRHINPYTGCLTEFYYAPGKEPIYVEGWEYKPSDGSPSGPDRSSYVDEHSVTDPDDPPYNYNSQDDVHERADETEDTDSSYEPRAEGKARKIRTRDVTLKDKKLKDTATKQRPNTINDRLEQVSSINDELTNNNNNEMKMETDVIPPFSDLQFTMKPVAKASKLSGTYKTVWEMGLESRRYD